MNNGRIISRKRWAAVLAAVLRTLQLARSNCPRPLSGIALDFWSKLTSHISDWFVSLVKDIVICKNTVLQSIGQTDFWSPPSCHSSCTDSLLCPRNQYSNNRTLREKDGLCDNSLIQPRIRTTESYTTQDTYAHTTDVKKTVIRPSRGHKNNSCTFWLWR